MMTLEQLPPKGVKREQAILELGKDEANGELLFQLVNTEKGKCKTAAQKALAQLEYAPAADVYKRQVTKFTHFEICNPRSCYGRKTGTVHGCSVQI